MLINGVASEQISIHDRGLLYGDGVFRTMRVRDQQVAQWPRHYRKLQQDCSTLGLVCPEAALLQAELQQLLINTPAGVAKIIITRGVRAPQSRGYAPAANPAPTRILTVAPLPAYSPDCAVRGVKLRLCQLRLSHQPGLAGVKHLNRLENVLAASEWSDADIAEGVMMDIAGSVIGGTRSNLFMVRNGELLTPDTSLCGVAGIQRDRIMEWADENSIVCKTGRFDLNDLFIADEVFMVNNLIGLWPVRELQRHHWDRYPVSMRIQEWLNHAPD
jgi:4-amino-4-deoxychorismate lyase